MIAGDKWSWGSHRSMAEVAETERLRAEKLRVGVFSLNPAIHLRLRVLEARAVEPERGPPPDIVA